MGEISDALARAREGEDAESGPKAPKRTPSRPESWDYPRVSLPRTPAGAEALSELLPSEVDTAIEAVTESKSIDDPAPEYRHTIPRNRDAGWLARLCAVDPDGGNAVRFRHLAVRLRSMLDERRHASVLVTSALPGEGKTTVAVNLAIALASVAPEYRIALVDLDLRRGRVAEVFGYKGEVGIERALAGEVPLEEARVHSDMPALDFFPVATKVPDAHRLIGAAAARLLQELHRSYDYVVCDGPPVLPVPDSPQLASHVGGCLAVAASGKTRHAAFREMMDLLPRSSVLGVFLNESRAAAAEDHYRDYPVLSVDGVEDLGDVA